MKTKITLLSLLFFTISFLNNFAKAQAPAWAWAKDTTGGSIATGGMVTDANGDVYVTNGLGDGFIEKYDANGNKIWSKNSIGDLESPPATQTYPSYITLDANGNIFVSGIFTSASITFESTTIQRVSTVDMYIAKFTNTGNLSWVKTEAIGNVGNVGFHLAADDAGDVIVVGSYSAATLTVGTTVFTNPCTSGGGCPSMLVIKYNGANGNVLWAKSSFAGVGTSYAYSVASNAANEIFVGGDFSRTGNTRNSIVKYNSAGDTLWTQVNGGWYVKTDASGNLYSGYDKVVNNGLIKKYNPATGAVLWTTTPTGNTSNKGVAMTTDGAGTMYYFGTFRSTSITFGAFTLLHNGTGSDDDFFIVNIDDAGNVIWATAVGGTSFDALNGTATDLNGNVFVGGFSLSPSITFGTTTLNILGVGYNVFFARLGSFTTGSSSLNTDNAFSVYPNPSTGIFNVSNISAKATVEVYNMLGEKVLQQQLTKEIDLSNSPKGIYFVKVISSGKTFTNKIIVQ